MKKIKIFPNFSLRPLLYNKKIIVPFSIIVAFLLWMAIVLGENQIRERTFTNMNTNINLENTIASENGMSIINDISDQKFTVVVRGPSNIVSSIKAEDIGIYASAAEIDAPGEYNLTVSASRNQATLNYEILSINPSTVKVKFDYVDTKEFTIKALAQGAAADKGLIAESAVVSGAESDTVQISGPRSVMNKIETVSAVARVNKTLSASQTFEADIILYDENGAEIDKTGLTLSTQKVNVTVPISKKKTVPVKAAFTNLPNGFDVDNIPYTVNHPTVTVIGTPEMVDKTTQITLSAIDITNISKDSSSFDVSAKLPDGVRLLDNIDYFTVTVNTKNFAEKTLTVSTVKVTGLAGGLTAGKATEIKNVKICGPRSVINKLTDEKIFAEIDLTNKTVGAHTVSAKINFEDFNAVWAVGSYNTTVTLK